MKIVIYSGGMPHSNEELNKAALALTGKSSPKLTLIPSSFYDAEVDFNYFVEDFNYLGVHKFLNFPIDIPFNQTKLIEAMSSDLIFLGGGNTFYFLRELKRKGMFKYLNQFLQKGGVLCGLSAGAIVLTPHVYTASFPQFDRDDNPFNMKNMKAMGILPFEFFPHYKNSKRYDVELMNYSDIIKHPLYASIDGSGIVIDQGRISFLGKNYLFYQGRKCLIAS